MRKTIYLYQDTTQRTDFLEHGVNSVLYTKLSQTQAFCAYHLETEARIKSAAPFSYVHTYANGEPLKPHMKKAVSESQLIVQRPKTASQNPSAARCKRPVSSAEIQQLLWAEQSPHSHRRPSY